MWNLQNSDVKNLIDLLGYGQQVMPIFCQICPEAKRAGEIYRAATAITLFVENPLDIKRRGCFETLEGFPRVAKSTPITVKPSKNFVVVGQGMCKINPQKLIELIGPDSCGKLRHIGKTGGARRDCHRSAIKDLSVYEELFPNVETCSIINRYSLQVVLDMQRNVYTLDSDTITDYSGIKIYYFTPGFPRHFYTRTAEKDPSTLFPKHKAMKMEKF